MSEPTYTPGPWVIERRWSNGCEICPYIVAPDHEWIAEVTGAPHLGFATTLPNARLLAAAPKLFQALTSLLADCKAIDPRTAREVGMDCRIKDAEDVIDKVMWGNDSDA